MPNGKYMLNDLEFEKEINKMTDRQLMEFTARQVWDVNIIACANRNRIQKLEGVNLRASSKAGGIGGIIGSAIGALTVFLVNHFTGRS